MEQEIRVEQEENRKRFVSPGKMAADCRLRVYKAVVNTVPGIRQRYMKKRNRVQGIKRVGAWLYLLRLNASYWILHNRSLEQIEKFPYYEEKELYCAGSESSISKREKPEELAERLADYDVISFDVFDTLIFRPVSEPADVFFLLGGENGYLDFKRLRQEMERQAREKKFRSGRTYEVTLEEIYLLLSKETGISKEMAGQEIRLEERLCFANPYMLQVVQNLKKKKKRLILTSDMYLPGSVIRQLLQHCGYPQFDACYISCEEGCSKHDGRLFQKLLEKEGRRCRMVHVGDNYLSDVERPKKYGIDTVHYVNVNAVGMPYRPEDMSVITGSAYRGVVNAHIHNGLHSFSREYEYGFIYGGLFVTGYCNFIHRYVKEHGTERILFLSRDGDILCKAYQRMYPKEENYVYAYWSRLAATKLASRYYKYDFFRRFLYHKINQNYSLESIFHSMELDFLLKEFLKKYGLARKSTLTDGNVGLVKEYLMKNWNRVCTSYQEQVEAGGQYYKDVLNGCSSAVAVDIGWAGSGAVTLDYMVNQVWKLDCEIVGIVAGTNSCHNAEPEMSEPLLQKGKLVSYLYSQTYNRDLWKVHDPAKNHNLYWEMFLDAPHGTLKGFYKDEEKKYRCEFKDYTPDERVEEIQRGILDFVELYQKYFGAFPQMFDISGRDAYAPMLLGENVINTGFMDAVSGSMDDANLV